MRLELLFIGKTKEKYLAAGIDDYTGRLSRYLNTDIRTLKESKPHKGTSDKQLIEKESDTLLHNVSGDYLVCLDLRGKQHSSEELAKLLERLEMQGVKKISFAIGGHLGMSETLLGKADKIISLSAMTFTHEMTRLILLEQLYRACTIKAGEKYHK